MSRYNKISIWFLVGILLLSPSPIQNDSEQEVEASRKNSFLWEKEVENYIKKVETIELEDDIKVIVTAQTLLTVLEGQTGRTLWVMDDYDYLHTVPEFFIISDSLTTRCFDDTLYTFTWGYIANTLEEDYLYRIGYVWSYDTTTGKQVANISFAEDLLGINGKINTGVLLSFSSPPYQRLLVYGYSVLPDYPEGTRFLALLDIPTLALVWLEPVHDWPYALDTHDLDGDGNDEIIVGYYLTDTVAIYKGENFEMLWNKTLTTGPYNSTLTPSFFAYHDITDNGKEDIIVAARGLYALDSLTGNILWSVDERRARDKCVITDITNDGKLEIVTMRLEDYMIVDVQTGQILLQGELPFYFDHTDLIVVDLDNDGNKEIIASSFYGGVTVFNSSFGVITRIPISGPVFALAVADLTQNGFLEILAGGDGCIVYAYIYVVHTFTPLFIIGGFVLFVLCYLLIVHFKKRTKQERRNFFLSFFLLIGNRGLT